MPTIVSNCPRCKASLVTFDTGSRILTRKAQDWQHHYEIFVLCRHCKRPSIFKIVQKSRKQSDVELFRNPENNIFSVEFDLGLLFNVAGHVSLVDESSIECPEHTPSNLKSIFDEGASCYSLACYNAAVAMFRLLLDLDTKELAAEHGINSALYARLNALFAQNLLPAELEDLSHCIRQNGNDGAHDGTVGSVEAQDIMDFTISYLETRYTFPHRVQARKLARQQRRDN